jgi:hypothetical protein
MEWINVDDKLPEAYKEVLIWNNKNGFAVAYYCFDTYWQDINYISYNPDFWMPLPEKPVF